MEKIFIDRWFHRFWFFNQIWMIDSLSSGLLSFVMEVQWAGVVPSRVTADSTTETEYNYSCIGCCYSSYLDLEVHLRTRSCSFHLVLDSSLRDCNGAIALAKEHGSHSNPNTKKG